MIAVAAFDPHAATPADWTEIHVYRRLRMAEDDPDDRVQSDADHEEDSRREWPLYQNLRHFARLDGVIVGTLGVSFRRAGTDDYQSFAPYCYVWGGVRKPLRRQGIGSAMLPTLLAFMAARGKTIASFDALFAETHAFLAAIGATEKHRVVENRLSLGGLDWATLAAWQADATVRDGALRWELHPGRVPLDRLAQLLPQLSALFAKVPLGDIDAPALRYEMAAFVARYQELDRHGGEHLLVLLLDGDTVAAVCEAAWDARMPDRVHQQLTAVAAAYRGRGLARAVKAAMLRLIRERHPDIGLMITYNAETNAAMLSINRRLGFVVHDRVSTYQLHRDALQGWLANRETASR